MRSRIYRMIVGSKHIMLLLSLTLLTPWIVQAQGGAFHQQQTLPEPRQLYVEREVSLQPFQLLFLTDPQNEGTYGIDEMGLVEVTRQHMMYVMGHADYQSSIIASISLVHTMRSDLIANGTMIAFSGMVSYYSLESNSTASATARSSQSQSNYMSTDQMTASAYLCFLGENETTYVDALHMAGWTSLEKVLVLNSRGEQIEYHNGNMTVENGSDQATNPTMDASMSIAFYLLAVFIPFSILAGIAISHMLYRAQRDLTCRNVLHQTKNNLAEWETPTNATKLRMSHLDIKCGDCMVNGDNGPLKQERNYGGNHCGKNPC